MSIGILPSIFAMFVNPPYERRNLTIRVWPCFAAMWSGVFLYRSVYEFGFSPSRMRILTRSKSPSLQALQISTKFNSKGFTYNWMLF